jgi:hypothetical protein
MDIATHYWTTAHDVPLKTIIEEARVAIARRPMVGRMWVVDDKGYVDLLRFAFRLFGLHKQSVYYAYFLVLAAPMVVYAVLFFRRPAYLFVLLAVLVAIYVTASILTVNDQLYSLHEQRLFSVVGIVPLLTLLLVMSAAEFSWGAAVAVVAQVAALVFVYFCRNDSLWETIVAVAAVPLLFWRLRHRFPDRRALALRIVWPVLVLALGLIALDRHKHNAFNIAYYRQGYAGHAYSHNLIMGLSFNPRLAAEYDLAVNDMKVVMLIGRRLVARGELKAPEDAVQIFNTDFNRYSAEARAVMFDIVTAHPIESALSIPYKAGPVRDEFRYIAGYSQDNPRARRAGHTLTPESVRHDRDLYYRPFQPFAVVVVLIGALLAAGGPPERWWTASWAVLMIWGASLLVPVTSIPMMYILGPSFVTTALVMYVLVPAAALLSFGAWFARPAVPR